MERFLVSFTITGVTVSIKMVCYHNFVKFQGMLGYNVQRVEHLGISAVSILRGYGFVQFMFEADAREAVRMENGGLLKGNKLGTCRY